MPNIGDTLPGSPPEKSNYRSCHRENGMKKFRYSTKADAKKALKQRIGTSSSTGKPFQHKAKVYKCKLCGYFHIGHRHDN